MALSFKKSRIIAERPPSLAARPRCRRVHTSIPPPSALATVHMQRLAHAYFWVEPSSLALPDFAKLHFESSLSSDKCTGSTLPFAASCSVQCKSGYVSNGGDPHFGCFQTLSHATLECTLPVPGANALTSTANQIVWCKAGGAHSLASLYLLATCPF